VAHSIGGHVVAFAPNRDRISAVLAVATPKPYWRLWRGPLKLGIYAFFHAMIPAAVALFGRLPLRLAGLDDLPAAVALDWIRVSLGEGDRDGRGDPLRARFAGFRAPVLSLSFGDDFLYAPRRAVEYLMDQYFVDAPTVQCHVEPAEHGLGAVGHSGFFGPAVPVDWWRAVSRWLEDAPAAPPRFGASRWRGSCSIEAAPADFTGITSRARAAERRLERSPSKEASQWF
jgi:predicted alpha/beta hydrolase